MSVLLFGVSHRSAPVSVLEQLSSDESEQVKLVDRIMQSPLVTEAMLLSTCNRVEVYAGVDGPEKIYWTAMPRSVLKQGMEAFRNSEDNPFADVENVEDLPFGHDDDEIAARIDGTDYYRQKVAASLFFFGGPGVDGVRFGFGDGTFFPDGSIVAYAPMSAEATPMAPQGRPTM